MECDERDRDGEAYQQARASMLLAEETYKNATGRGYTALAKQIEPILNRMRQATEEN